MTRPATPPLRRRVRRQRPSDAEGRAALDQQIADTYAQLGSIRATARHLGWSFGLVQDRLHQAGVPLRPRGGQRRVTPDTPDTPPHTPSPGPGTRP